MSTSELLIIILTSIYVLATIYMSYLSYKQTKNSNNQILLLQKQIIDSKDQLRIDNMPLLEISYTYNKKIFDESDIYEFSAYEEGKNNYLVWNMNLLLTNIGVGSAINTKLSIEFVDINKAYIKKLDRTFIKVNQSEERLITLKTQNLNFNKIDESNLHNPNWKTNNKVLATIYYQDVIGNTYKRSMKLNLTSYPTKIGLSKEIEYRNKVELIDITDHIIEKNI